MANYYQVERVILDIVPEDKPIHKKVVRRRLDQEFEVRISYPVVEGFLQGLVEDGALVTGDGLEDYYRKQDSTNSDEGEKTRSRVATAK